MSLLYADAAPAATDAVAGAASSPSPIVTFLPFLLLIVIFYFLLIRPQQKTAKLREGMLKTLKEGDKVVLVSGVYATVTKVEDDVLRLQIADGVTVKASRSAVERQQA